MFAVTAVRAGVPLGDLREVLGHGSLTMVLRYACHAPGDAAERARDRIEAYVSRGVGKRGPGRARRSGPGRRREG